MSGVTILQPPNIQPYRTSDGSWRWMSLTSILVEISFGDTQLYAGVPAMFETDLASIPKLAQWAFFLNPYEPDVVLASLVHDWLTPTDAERADPNNQWGQREMFPQTIAAGVFYELMKSQGVPMLRRKVYYHAVVFGINKRFW